MSPNDTPRTKRCQYYRQGNLVGIKVKTGSNPKSSGGIRGNITTFSKASRRRLIQLVARLEETETYFITVTYPGQEYGTIQETKQQLRALLKRLQRYAPGSSGVWRLERQRRGAPHYHIMWFRGRYLDKSMLQAWWREIIGCVHEAPFTRIDKVTGFRKSMSYVCKYVAKVDDGRDQHSSEASASRPSSLGRTGLDYSAYWAAPGRWWGYYGEDDLPFGRLMAAQIDYGQWYWIFRRITRRLYDTGRGLTSYWILTDDPETLERAFVAALKQAS